MPTKRRRPPVKPVRIEMSEAQLQAAVIETAERLGWFVHYIPDWMYGLAIKAQARGMIRNWSPPGFPDLVLMQGLRDARTPARLVFMELKSKRGGVRPVQLEWLAGLSRVQGIEVYVMRPVDLTDGTIDRLLMNGPVEAHPGTIKELRQAAKGETDA